MDDFTHPVEPAQGLLNSPVLVIIAQHALARTSILNILKRELAGFEIVEMATTSGPSWLSGRDIRLIALNIEDKEITAPAIERSLAFLADSVRTQRLPCCQIATTKRRLWSSRIPQLAISFVNGAPMRPFTTQRGTLVRLDG